MRARFIPVRTMGQTGLIKRYDGSNLNVTILFVAGAIKAFGRIGHRTNLMSLAYAIRITVCSECRS
jgi:hypothetical protein